MRFTRPGRIFRISCAIKGEYCIFNLHRVRSASLFAGRLGFSHHGRCVSSQPLFSRRSKIPARTRRRLPKLSPRKTRRPLLRKLLQTAKSSLKIPARRPRLRLKNPPSRNKLRPPVKFNSRRRESKRFQSPNRLNRARRSRFLLKTSSSGATGAFPLPRFTRAFSAIAATFIT